MKSSLELAQFYENARKKVIESGFAHEREWQDRVLAKSFTEQDLLREAAWVILCSGFREAYVAKIFGYISLVCIEWENAGEIVKNRDMIKQLIFDVFKNTVKVEAILSLAGKVAELGFDEIKKKIQDSPTEYLQLFQMIGPVTSKHLAKNLGFNIAKNDRHLIRIADENGYSSVEKFCAKLSKIVDESIAVIDITLWRYGVLQSTA